MTKKKGAIETAVKFMKAPMKKMKKGACSMMDSVKSALIKNKKK